MDVFNDSYQIFFWRCLFSRKLFFSLAFKNIVDRYWSLHTFILYI